MCHIDMASASESAGLLAGARRRSPHPLLMPPLLRSRIAADDSLRACNALWDAVLLDELRQPLLRREIPEFPDQ